MAKCYFCGYQFKNKQSVRAHLKYCFAYQNREDVAWGETVEFKRQIEMLKHKIDMIKLYDNRGMRILLGDQKNMNPVTPKRKIPMVCNKCGRRWDLDYPIEELYYCGCGGTLVVKEKDTSQ